MYVNTASSYFWGIDFSKKTAPDFQGDRLFVKKTADKNSGA